MNLSFLFISFSLLLSISVAAKWDYWYQRVCAQSPAIESDHDVYYSMKSDQGWVGNCVTFSTDT